MNCGTSAAVPLSDSGNDPHRPHLRPSLCRKASDNHCSDTETLRATGLRRENGWHRNGSHHQSSVPRYRQLACPYLCLLRCFSAAYTQPGAADQPHLKSRLRMRVVRWSRPDSASRCPRKPFRLNSASAIKCSTAFSRWIRPTTPRICDCSIASR